MVSSGHCLLSLWAFHKIIPTRTKDVLACFYNGKILRASPKVHPSNLDVEMATLQVYLHDVSQAPNIYRVFRLK